MLIAVHLWNVGKLLPDYTALQPRRQPSSYSMLWEPEILLSNEMFQKGIHLYCIYNIKSFCAPISLFSILWYLVDYLLYNTGCPT
jgi:hypothetical protein